MSGPVAEDDLPARPEPPGPPAPPAIEITESRTTVVGGAPVRRALPKRTRRTVGAWCFLDQLGPAQVTDEWGLEVGPHPHTGLQTVTWLVAGQQLHRDSLGTEQTIRPGQLNLMTAGRGVAHAEETLEYRGPVHGVQLWVAQPDATRAGDPDFEHHADLPQAELDALTATVLVGRFAGEESKARADTPLVGLDLQVRAGRSLLPLQRDFEHAVVVLDGEIALDGQPVRPGALAYLGRSREQLQVEASENARAVLVGGEPFESPVLMWWNFVARTHEELAEALAAWQAADERFGDVRSDLGRIPAPPLLASRVRGRAGP